LFSSPQIFGKQGIVSKQEVDIALECLRETSFSGIFLYLLFVLSYCFMQTSAKGQSEKHIRVPCLLALSGKYIVTEKTTVDKIRIGKRRLDSVECFLRHPLQFLHFLSLEIFADEL